MLKASVNQDSVTASSGLAQRTNQLKRTGAATDAADGRAPAAPRRRALVSAPRRRGGGSRSRSRWTTSTSSTRRTDCRHRRQARRRGAEVDNALRGCDSGQADRRLGHARIGRFRDVHDDAATMIGCHPALRRGRCLWRPMSWPTRSHHWCDTAQKGLPAARPLPQRRLTGCACTFVRIKPAAAREPSSDSSISGQPQLTVLTQRSRCLSSSPRAFARTLSSGSRRRVNHLPTSSVAGPDDLPADPHRAGRPMTARAPCRWTSPAPAGPVTALRRQVEAAEEPDQAGVRLRLLPTQPPQLVAGRLHRDSSSGRSTFTSAPPTSPGGRRHRPAGRGRGTQVVPDQLQVRRTVTGRPPAGLPAPASP